MSSREIADLIGSSHDNVLKTIRALVAKGVVSSNDTPYVHPQNGQVYREFLLSQRDTLVVVSGYNVELRARIIDRWQELEAQAGQFQIPATYAEALQAAADQAKDNQSLRLVILDQAPKVAAINRLAAAVGAICITDAAKHLQVQPSKLFAWMQQNRWIFRRHGSGRWTAYQPRITSGHMVHKVTALKPDSETGAERAAFDPLVTPKGLARLAELNIGASK
ncbi:MULTISPECIES: phage antirepressor KilAC domain-containing protein [Pseudomonas]|uniref:phage antirepressor KilAC domain-containing protein n=1 Tax=Pseudomonas TaxID=286 RepID=UPI001070B70C|nr:MULTISPECIES: phage regulatory protein/antirepressor Ant [Pseudomonas]QBR34452.1 DNA-binding protein [Pseudomonas sp. S150]UZT95731.1 phage regulatory protein/antirepressor Ant [Pseudomonas koreensis]